LGERVFERFQHSSVQIEVSQIIIHKTDQPDVVVDFFYVHGLTSENRAEINFVVAEADASAIRDHNDFVVKGIVDIGQPLVGTRRMPIDLSRTFHVQGFMGTFVVEDLDKIVEERSF
jgi:hypothetical protein